MPKEVNVRDTDLPAFAQQLRSEGYEAREVTVSVPGKGSQIGLMLAGVGFFPLWELNDPANAGRVAARDFPNIKEDRPANWEPVEPRFWGRAAEGR
jgi:hypothetical protein